MRMNPIHFSSELYMPFSMVNYPAPPSQTNISELSHAFPSLLLQKGLAWPTAVASFPHGYANMWLQSQYTAGAGSHSHPRGYCNDLVHIALHLCVSILRSPHLFPSRQTDREHRTLSSSMGQELKFAAFTKQKLKACILFRERRLCLTTTRCICHNRRTSRTPSWENGPCGTVSLQIVTP